MSSEPNKRPMDFATLFYRQLPAVYRERDNTTQADDGGTVPGDLAELSAIWGDLLDAVYRTLLQRYYDIFPETEGVDAEGLPRGAQAWVLPYIAQLLDVVPVSPLEAGRRQEILRAVEWRQRKGTLKAIEDIAEKVAQLEVEVVEGQRKIAVTPRVGFPLLPARAFGEDPARFPRAFPSRRAEHPGLPGGCVDFRKASRAVRSDDPSAKETGFGGVKLHWRQIHRHGAPCFPGSFQDAAPRTVDLRTPGPRRGHAHPRRVVLHLAPFAGFFSPQAPSVEWADIRDAVLNGQALPEDSPLALTVAEGERRLRAKTPTPLRIDGAAQLEGAARWRLENLWFDGLLEVADADIELRHCALRQLQADAQGGYRLKARACLFNTLLAPHAWAELEYVTVLGRMVAEHLNASDCLFIQQPRRDLAGFDVPASGCVRFSRLEYAPPAPLASVPAERDWRAQGQRSALKVHEPSCTVLKPLFWRTDFGAPGCGVLHPAAPDALRFGAEDGGEMGACHDDFHTLREAATLDKLKDYLPVGMEAVLAPDASLECAPPALR